LLESFEEMILTVPTEAQDMATFMEDLWSSVFTPGATPALLVATNATFAALQAVLFVLLIATYSIHFVILSFLSGALWASINWFAKEVREIQARQEEEQDKSQLAGSDGPKPGGSNRRPGGVDSADSETETEGVSETRRRKPSAAGASQASTSTTGTSLHPPGSDVGEVLRKRASLGGDSSDYASTDSEWEKVEGDKSS
jgi:hypothetical protein